MLKYGEIMIYDLVHKKSIFHREGQGQDYRIDTIFDQII